MLIYLPLAGQDVHDYSYAYNADDVVTNTSDVDWQEPTRKTSEWGLGIRVLQQFNMPVLHSIVALNLTKGNSNLYLGPHFTHISERQIKAEDEISFSQNTYGLNLGYFYVLNTRNRSFDVFLQIDFSLYQAEEQYYTGYHSEVQSETSLVVENCISVGISYQISSKFDLFTGYGIGSTGGFFFMFEDMIPHVYFGLQYNFK